MGIRPARSFRQPARRQAGSRVTFCDTDKDCVVTSADIRQTNHYYPFGLNMEGNWTSSGGNGEGNKYGYNGKELNDDFGLGWNDYGARFYDAAVGRWVAVDPLASLYHSESSYHYAKNNPVRYVDLDGMASYSYDWKAQKYKNESGDVVEWSEVESSIAKPKLTAFIANIGKGNGGVKGFATMVSTATTIINRNLGNEDKSEENIRFKPIGVKEAKSKEDWGENELFLAVVDYMSEYGSTTQEGNSRADEKDGRIEGYNFSRDPETYPYGFASFVNIRNPTIALHNNPTYAAGYIIAHEILHQLQFKSSCFLNGKGSSNHYNTIQNLNHQGQGAIIPNGLLVKGLHQAERIIPEQLKVIKAFLKK
ncbi:MAG: RHS repeat-associated core domain-containing protein [Saprospiraceae bacterium]|nr:RHS repeat-associated core domain-containing protein [Saprospiraceae bacterium]